MGVAALLAKAVLAVISVPELVLLGPGSAPAVSPAGSLVAAPAVSRTGSPVAASAASPVAAPVPSPVVAPAASRVASPSPAPAPRCGLPAQALDLTNWKITLPVAKPDNAKSPLEVTQPRLAGYAQAPWFVPGPHCNAVVFRAPVNGVTTSGSRYPRSELREMTDNGTENASWSSTAGTHRITVTEAFEHLPAGKPELVGLQIHNADDDITVFRLEGRNLYLTDGNNPHYKLVTDHYVLGAKFDATFEVSGGQVRAFYNGVPQATLSRHFRGAYFKAGAYTQANCANSAPCSADNYGETIIYRVSVYHQVTTWELVWDWITTWGPIVVAVVLVVALGLLLGRRLRRRRAT